MNREIPSRGRKMWMFRRAVVFVAFGITPGFGCNPKPAHAILVVSDPEGMAAAATQVAVGTSLEAMSPYSTEGGDFPLSITVWSDRELRAFVWAEARTGNGVPLGRCRVELVLARQTQNPVTCELRPACDNDPDCDDGLFCNGAELCLERSCRPPQDPCPSSSFDCVEAACLEATDECSVVLHHERCSPVPGEQGELELAYCEPSVGCTRGVPCAVVGDCDDGLICNGEERCVSYHCLPGVPPDVDDHNLCTVDGCAEGIGRVNVPVRDGTWCGVGVGAGEPQVCADSRCVPSVCGDGILDERIESCDEGTANSATEPNACRPGCTRPICGDGVVDPGYGELCDDGNTSDSDGCLGDCTPNICGDGIVNPDKEECDDDNEDNEDPCLNDCRLNECGDGFRNHLTEACDDGNADDTDRCIDCAVAYCGDGYVFVGVEACDDGNTLSGDGCRGDCQKLEACDGILDAGEPCDDGNTNPNDGCNACTQTQWRSAVELGFGERDGAPRELRLSEPLGVDVDPLGNLFISDNVNNRVWRYDAATEKVTVFAGTGFDGYSGDGGPATHATFPGVGCVAVDGLGTVYITDGIGHNIRAVDPDGIVTTVAGTGVAGFSDHRPATLADLNGPQGIAVDGLGNVYFGEIYNCVVRRIDTEGFISTVAGNQGVCGYADDSGGVEATGPSGLLRFVVGVAVDADGNVYVADRDNHRVRKIDFTSGTGILTTVAGTGGIGFSMDGGQAISTDVVLPGGIDLDQEGNLYITELQYHRIRKVNPAGTIRTVAGTGAAGYSGDGDPAILAQLSTPLDVAIGPNGELYIADLMNNVVRLVKDGTITTLVGTGLSALFAEARFARDGGLALTARLAWPKVPLPRGDGVIFSGFLSSRIRQVDAAGIITTIAGNGQPDFVGSGDGGPAADATLSLGHGLAEDSAGNLYLADLFRVRRIDPGGTITAFAGTGVYAYTGDGGPAADAEFGLVAGLAVDASDNLYIADGDFDCVRMVDTNGDIDTVVGTGIAGYTGDGGPALLAQLDSPAGIAHDGIDLWIVDAGNHAVRKVDAGGNIDTVAGTGSPGFSGDRFSADLAALNRPTGIAIDLDGGVLITDTGNSRVRKIAPGGTIDTIAGTGAYGYYGEGGPASQAVLAGPRGIAVAPSGALFITDSDNTSIRIGNFWFFELQNNNFIRRVEGGIITTIAGLVYPGDGAFEDAFLGSPSAAVSLADPNRWLVADGIEGRIRLVDFAAGRLTTVAGHRGGLSDADNPSRSARLSRLFDDAAGVAFDAGGPQLFVTERSGHTIRRLEWTDIDDLSTWTAGPYAGQLDNAGYANGEVANSLFFGPAGLAFDDVERLLYVADAGNHVVRVIDVDASSVALFAGVPQTPGFFGDDHSRLEAIFSSPEALALAPDGGLYIADLHNHRVRRVDPMGTVTTVLGYGVPSSSGVGTPARNFPVDSPRGLTADSFGNLFVTSRNAVRLVAAGDDAVAGGDDTVSTIYGVPPRVGLPESVTRCLADVRLLPGEDELLLLDACQGFLVRLTREEIEP